LFRGAMPPRAEEFRYLAKSGIEVLPREPAPPLHWALDLKHPQWGEATLACFREIGPPPRVLIDVDTNLTEQERQQVLAAGSLVLLTINTRRTHVLRDRKLMLRFLRAVMGDLGLAAMDHVAQRFWSRAALDEELSHDADLDIEGIHSLHAVSGEDSEQVQWLHSHGLAEIGFLDFDVLNPAEELQEGACDMLRAIAFMIVEGRLGRATASVSLAHPGGDIRSVSVAEFKRKADPRFVALRDDPDGAHDASRVVLCDPAGGLLGRWFGKVRPSRFLAGPLEGESVISFSSEASELMGLRARNTYDLFRKIRQQLAEFGFPALVKIGYRTDGPDEKDLEHLWFEVHETLDDVVEGTLINEPFGIARLKAGQRGRHPVALMSDWQILTIAGSINPRHTTALRVIRENWEGVREAVREAREEEPSQGPGEQ
jgi:uncharacterized protein YegJ (DUF2314 family)